MAKTLHPWTWRRLGLAGGLTLPILLPLGSAKAGPPAGPIFRAQATQPQPQPQPVKPEPVSTTPPTQVADSVVANMKVTLDLAETSLKGGSRDVTTRTVDKINVYVRLAETRQVDANLGVNRALAALKEAMGLCGDAPLHIAIDTLPSPA